MVFKRWSHDELIQAMNLYCRLPFGLFHQRNCDVIALAESIGRTPASVAMKLCNFASLDSSHRERGVKGLGGSSRADRAVWAEFHADWESLAVHSEQMRESGGTVAVTTKAVGVDDVVFSGETEVDRNVRTRLVQRFFRDSVLAAYASRCCVTGIDVPQLLIASHILRWSDHPQQRANPRNGLCLSRIHDAAFDQGLIGFDEEYRMVLSRELSESTSNEVLSACFRRYEGQPIQLPDRFQPETSFLEYHRNSVFRG